MTAEITDIRARIDLLADRIAWIDQRRAAIKATIDELQKEANVLYLERGQLDSAGQTLRSLLDRPKCR
jgi:hypothetical protein